MEEPPGTANPEPGLFEQTQLSAAAVLRRGARVVWLTPPAGAAPGQLLRASVVDARGCLVDGRVDNLEELASRILAGLGAPRFARAAGVLEAFLTHLASRGRRLVVGIRHAAGLPAGALRELAVLLQRPGGGLAIVLESRGSDPTLWTALGMEPTCVRPPGVPPTAVSAAPRRVWRRPMGWVAAAGLATASAVTVILLASGGPSQDPLSATAVAREAAAVPRVAEAAPEVEPLPLPEREPERTRPAPAAHAAPPVDRRREDPEAVASGRRALAALADARTDAEWEEGTRILHEIGPQPALMETLDELGARPGCVRKRGCVSTRDRLQAALCTAWADAVERGEAPAGLRCS